MGCGCEQRAGWIESKTGIPAVAQHATLGFASAFVGLVIWARSPILGLLLLLASAYAFRLAYRSDHKAEPWQG